MLKATFNKYELIFKIPGGTSRGILKTKDSWFISLFDENNPEICGYGEASIIKGLSIDKMDKFDEKLIWCLENINSYQSWDTKALTNYPSIKFALETAFLDLNNGGNRILFDSKFTEEKEGIHTNGLVWMGTHEFMQKQIIDKIENGFRCIKIKIGAINFNEELSLLKLIRNDFKETELELRVDANGAFSPAEAVEKLKRLSDYHIHSIEQPIKQKQWEAMADLCLKTPIPIALDEELIGVDSQDAAKLLDYISPQYIILKPSLLGGFKSSEGFINEANKRNIGWWVTSALEANIGLNAIAQWTYTLGNNMPHGLGTGLLFTNNIDSPLYLKESELYFNKSNNWRLEKITNA